MNILVATTNPFKLREIRRIFADRDDIWWMGLGEAGVGRTPAEDALEPHDTFEANAASKARYFYRRSGHPTVADDSGLVVDALDGQPGVRSKRFAPVEGDVSHDERDEANNRYLLEQLDGVPEEERSARYVCSVVLIGLEGGPKIVVGETHGRIATEPRGEGGFGYDPLFVDPASNRTFAELSIEEKNALSHRGRAFRALGELLTEDLVARWDRGLQV